jgi:hypothetical protein
VNFKDFPLLESQRGLAGAMDFMTGIRVAMMLDFRGGHGL